MRFVPAHQYARFPDHMAAKGVFLILHPGVLVDTSESDADESGHAGSAQMEGRHLNVVAEAGVELD